MTLNKGINQIRKLLDELTETKTDKERISELLLIKALIEETIEPLKIRRDKKRVAYAVKTRIIKKALKQFLTALDKIYAKHQELGDTDVRDQMYRAIYRSFIQPQRDYSLPKKFGMFSDGGNDLVRAALQSFLTHPEVLAASRALKSPEDRFAAFQDGDVRTTEGTSYFEYFGYSNKPSVA
jgi:hypothetical protein